MRNTATRPAMRPAAVWAPWPRLGRTSRTRNNWCKEGKCLYSNQSKCRYEHKDEHKAKFPDAHMTQRSRSS